MAKAELKIDLIDLLHKTIDNEDKRVALTPIVQRDVIKQEFGNRLVDVILDRTDSGVDKNGRPFKKYSKAYKKSDAFAAYNKTDEVNLELTGAMKSDLSIISVGRSTVTLGFTDSEQEEKALRHINGDGVPVRDFFGVPDEVQREILEDIIKQHNENDNILETVFLETFAELNTTAATLDNDVFFFLTGGDE